jgi:hypothetical protein
VCCRDPAASAFVGGSAPTTESPVELSRMPELVCGVNILSPCRYCRPCGLSPVCRTVPRANRTCKLRSRRIVGEDDAWTISLVLITMPDCAGEGRSSSSAMAVGILARCGPVGTGTSCWACCCCRMISGDHVWPRGWAGMMVTGSVASACVPGFFFARNRSPCCAANVPSLSANASPV